MHLSREAERRISLAPYCVEYLYLSVNADNAKAKALYTKLGWSACSGRELSFSLLSQPASLADRAAKAALSSAVRMADASEAARLTANAYADRDLSLAPDELARALFHSELYLGTYQCSDGRGSSAALSLWHGSAFTGFRPIRLLVPFDWWVRTSPFLGLTATAAIAATCRALALAARARAPSAPLAASLCAAAALATAYGGFRALRFFWWARTRTHFRARAFAAVHEGPAWEPLMAAVYARVHDEARRLGFALLVTNTDQHDPVNRALKPGPRKAAAVPASISRPSSGDGLPTSGDKAEAEALLGTGGPTNDGKPAKKPRTEFWHKALSPALLRDGGLPCLAPDAFFDPRDF